MHLLSRLSLFETGKLALHTSNRSTALFLNLLLDFSPEVTSCSRTLDIIVHRILIVIVDAAIADYSFKRTPHPLNSLRYPLEVDTLWPSLLHSFRQGVRFEVMSLTSCDVNS